MKILLHKKRLSFYLSLWMVWVLLWLFNSFINHPRAFAPTALNEVWQSVYLVLVNYLFFEFGLPFIIKKRSTVLINILIGLFLGAFQLVLVSFGLYAWNKL